MSEKCGAIRPLRWRLRFIGDSDESGSWLKSPKVKKLAKEIVEAREREITLMKRLPDKTEEADFV